MPQTVKLLSNSVTLGTSNSSVSGAKLVRLLAKSPVVVKVFDTVANVQVGSVEMLANSVLVLQKKVTDVLASNDASNCVAVSVSYTN
jgi:hypothetical protein